MTRTRVTVYPKFFTAERVGKLWWKVRPDLALVTAETHFLDERCQGRHLIELIDRLAREFGTGVVPAELVAARTVGGIGSLVEERIRGGRTPLLVPFTKGGCATPLVFVSGADGTFARMFEMTRCFPDARPCYGFESPGVRRGERPCRTIRSLARRYAGEIRREFGGDPVILLGFCLGGIVAQEIARQLAAGGTATPLLVLGDSPCPPVVRVTHPWSSRRYRTKQRALEMARWLTAYETRRLQGRIGRNRRTYGMAALAHRPEPIETDAVLLTSEAYRRQFGCGDLGWRPFLRARLTLVEIAKTHMDVLRYESAAVMLAIGEQLADRGL